MYLRIGESYKLGSTAIVTRFKSGSPTRLLLDFANFPKSVGDHVYGHRDHVYGHGDLSMDMGHK